MRHLLMATIKVHVELKVYQTGYVGVERKFLSSDMKQVYNDYIANLKEWGYTEFESREGFEMRFLQVDVVYDARKRRVSDENILQSLSVQGYMTLGDQTMLGGLYTATDKLRNYLDSQVTDRKVLAGVV